MCFNKLTLVDELGGASQYIYDHHGRLSEKIDPMGRSHKYFPKMVKGLINDLPNGFGTMDNPAPAILHESIHTSYIDPMGNEHIAKTNKFGSITEAPNCKSCEITSEKITFIERDENDNPVKIRRPNGSVTTMEYDQKGNLISSNENGIITSFVYAPNYNQVTQITDPQGNITTIEYDAKGNPITTTDSLGNATQMTYDARGLLLTSTDALGNTTTYAYDSEGNLISITDPSGNMSDLSYDSAGNTTSSSDPMGNTTHYTYDSMNHLTSVTDANGNVTMYAYDPAGNLLGVTDANGNITSFEYDSQGRTIATIEGC